MILSNLASATILKASDRLSELQLTSFGLTSLMCELVFSFAFFDLVTNLYKLQGTLVYTLYVRGSCQESPNRKSACASYIISKTSEMELPSLDISIPLLKALSLIQQYKAPLLITLSLPLLYMAYSDYSNWHQMGAGGIPHNVSGWVLQNLLRLRGTQDKRSKACYDTLRVQSPLEQASFLDIDLPRRASPRTGPWVVPHRQLEDFASEKLRQVSLSV